MIRMRPPMMRTPIRKPNPIAVGRPVPPPPSFDDSDLRRRLRLLEGREIPQFDPSALQARLAELESRQVPVFDPSQLQAGIQGLSDRISNIPQFDPSALQNRLSALENRQAPTFNPDDFREQFLNIAREGIDIPLPPAPFDPSSLQNRLQALENLEMPQFDPSRLQERLSALENIKPIAPPPAFDPSSLQARLDALENREPVAAPPAFDPSGLLARLDDFETRLGAMQQPLPIQPPGDLNLDIKEDAPDIRDLAKELPEGGTIFDRLPVQKPTPPMSIERLGEDRLVGAPVGNLQMGEGVPFTPPNQRPTPPMSIGGPGGGRTDPRMFPGGSRTFDERGETLDPLAAPNNLVTTGPDNIGGAPSLVDQQQDLTTGDDMLAPTIANEQPFAAGVTQVATGLDPLTEQLLFGIGGQGGFIPGAMRAAEKVFYDDQGNPVVIDEQVAGFSPDQLQAMQMQREALGIQNPYLQEAGQAFGAGTQALEEGLQRGRTAAIGALEATKGGVGSLQQGLGESADILRGTLGGYDPSMTSQFYDPFEDRVVQQTIEDIMEQGAKSDIGARASDIARGGESAFGSRARLGAGERQEALGRGLAEALSGIRSRGFREAQQTGLGEFARQKAAERAASTGLASLAGQGFGGSQALAGALSGLGQTEQDIGQQRFSGQFGLGTSLQGLGAQAAGASASDIAALYGMGSQQQGQAQAMLDAQRRNLQQRQMTPLLQYQALAPFISMAPAGQFTTTTQFAPPPSPMQSGLSTGLAAFGALGKLYGGSS
tara:strand:- start:10520 stop:12838 length:2319 start_codon:yes stop_codon:yes gene_type:complete